MTRHDPGAEPRPTLTRPRRHALHGVRQIMPALPDPATPDPIDDETREWCAVESPAVVRRNGLTLTEAFRAEVDAQARDSVALDPAHGIAQADAIRDARRRRAHEVAWQTVKDIDGPLMPATIARLVVEALERDGVL